MSDQLITVDELAPAGVLRVAAARKLHKRFAAHRLHGEWFNERAPGLLRLADEWRLEA